MAVVSDVIYMVVVAMETNDTTWFRLMESTRKARYTCQISSQSDEWCQKWRGGI